VIEFRPLAESDLPLVRDWLEREHVARCWRDPIEEALAEYRAAIDGREPTHHYLIELGGRPVGMIQTYLASDYPEWEAIVQVGVGVAGVDLLIGEADLIGGGLGPRVLAEFARDVVFADPETCVCVATVEEANRRSWRAFEKAGFRHVRDVEEEGLPNRMMRLDRPGLAA
jgi:aminoglycoside 6'-N-acetyltransferase